MINSQVYTAILLSLIFLVSCDKDEDMPCQTPEPQSKTTMLEFSFNADDELFSYNEVYDFNGVKVSFSELRLYLSDMVLSDSNGNSELMEETAILLDVGSAENIFTIGNTDYEYIEDLQMLFGLNNEVNHLDPTTQEAPLNNAGMHWGWNPDSGYKFLKAEFSVDTNDDGTPDSNGSIHCATDGLARDIMLDVNMNVTGSSAKVMLNADVIAFFNGVDFLNLMGTHGDSDLTNLVADNVAAAINIQ